MDCSIFRIPDRRCNLRDAWDGQAAKSEPGRSQDDEESASERPCYP